MSLKARLDAAFNQFTVAKRAEETTRALNDYSNQPKEIHSHFTELVDRIFTSSGWGMHDLTLQNKKDYEAIMTRVILAPNDLLTLFELRAQNFRVNVEFSTCHRGQNFFFEKMSESDLSARKKKF